MPKESPWDKNPTAAEGMMGHECLAIGMKLIRLGNIVKELPTTWKAKSRELSIKEAYEIIESLPEQIGMIKGAIREKFDKLVELDLWYGSLEKRLAAEKEFIALRESLSQKLYYHAITQPHECSLKS